MPTDLPEFFSGTKPLEPDRKAARKAARRLAYRSLSAIAKALTLHYGVTLAAVAVIAAAGFHGVFRTAVSATALGLLARWYLPNKATQQAFAKQPQLQEVELTPDQLAGFFKQLSEDVAADAAPDKHTGPYL